MFDGARHLSVACHTPNDCWIAMGARQAWRWRGDRFLAGGPSLVVLGVIRADSGEIFALHRGSDQATIQISRVSGDSWISIPDVVLKPPGSQPDIDFLRFSPKGQLWVGLQYRDGVAPEPISWGVAVVDLDAGRVEYHRQRSPHESHESRRPSRDRTPEPPTQMLPIPNGAVDVAFAQAREMWFATSEGAAHLQDDRIRVWSERDLLPSEILHAIAVAPGGTVYSASSAGVGVFDGADWAFPRELAFATADLAIGPEAVLWMATERGIAVYDGKTVHRLDVRNGLIDNAIHDLAVDQFGRVWARGARSLVLVTP